MAVKVTNDYITTPNIIDVREHNYLSDAVTAIGDKKVTLIISEPINVEEHVVVPPNITLKFTKGGMLRISSGCTVIVNGEIEAGLWQIFDGNGNVSFGAASIDEIHTCWFPSSVEGFQQAVNAALGKTLHIDDGTYNISQVTIVAPLNIIGNGPGRSILHVETSSTYGLRFDTTLTQNLIAGFRIDLADVTNNCVGLYFRYGITYPTISNIEISGDTDSPDGPIGIRIDGVDPGGSGNNCHDIVIDKCKFNKLYRGMYLCGQNIEGGKIVQCRVSHSKFNQCYTHITGEDTDLVITFNDFGPVTENGIERPTDTPQIFISGDCPHILFVGNSYTSVTNQLVVSLASDTFDIPYPVVVFGDTAEKERYYSNSGDVLHITYNSSLDFGGGGGGNCAKLNESNTFTKSQHINDILEAAYVFSRQRKQLLTVNKQFTYTGSWQVSNSIADGNLDTYSQSNTVGSTIEWDLDEHEQWSVNGSKIYVIAYGHWITNINDGAIWALDMYNSNTDTWEEVGTFQTDSKLYVFDNPIPYNEPPLCTKLRIRVVQVGTEDYCARIAELRVFGQTEFGPIENIISGKGDFWELTCQGNQVWHEGNDGSGSGLDADMLDGHHANEFLTSSDDLDSIYVRQEDYEDSDVLEKIKNVDGSGSGLDADMLDGHHANEFLTSSDDLDSIYVRQEDYEDSDVLEKIKNVDGSGSGLDADMLDGYHASNFASSSHNHDYTYVKRSDYGDTDVLNKIKNVDGSGSGLDADMVDGRHAGNSSGQIPVSNGTLSMNLNADMVDGHHASDFASSSHNHDSTYVKLSDYEDSDVLNKIKNVDGSGSGLDADFVRGLPADFTCSKSSNGYTKLPNGLIIQWTSPSWDPGDGASHTFSFPISFPNSCLQVVLSSNTGKTEGGADEGARIISFNQSSFTIKSEWKNGHSQNWRIIAIGY